MYKIYNIEKIIPNSTHTLRSVIISFLLKQSIKIQHTLLNLTFAAFLV